MPVTIEPTEVVLEPKKGHSDTNGGSHGGGWRGDRWEGRRNPDPGDFQTPSQAYHLGMMLGLSSVVMLFVALSSAYVMREGAGQDWHPIAMPSLLLPNTLALLLSSFTLELSRGSLKRQAVVSFRRWLIATALLGMIFLLGQLTIWRALTTQGIYLDSSSHSSFFYLLTGAHGVHLIGGVIALGYLVFRTQRSRVRDRLTQTALDVVSLYWHFMDGLWVYLLLLLFVWR
jgi:cytochrome c oxidase subunit III